MNLLIIIALVVLGYLMLSGNSFKDQFKDLQPIHYIGILIIAMLICTMDKTEGYGHGSDVTFATDGGWWTTNNCKITHSNWSVLQQANMSVNIPQPPEDDPQIIPAASREEDGTVNRVHGVELSCNSGYSRSPTDTPLLLYCNLDQETIPEIINPNHCQQNCQAPDNINNYSLKVGEVNINNNSIPASTVTDDTRQIDVGCAPGNSRLTTAPRLEACSVPNGFFELSGCHPDCTPPGTGQDPAADLWGLDPTASISVSDAHDKLGVLQNPAFSCPSDYEGNPKVYCEPSDSPGEWGLHGCWPTDGFCEHLSGEGDTTGFCFSLTLHNNEQSPDDIVDKYKNDIISILSTCHDMTAMVGEVDVDYYNDWGGQDQPWKNITNTNGRELLIKVEIHKDMEENVIRELEEELRNINITGDFVPFSLTDCVTLSPSEGGGEAVPAVPVVVVEEGGGDTVDVDDDVVDICDNTNIEDTVMCGSSGTDLPGRAVKIIANCEDKTESDICKNFAMKSPPYSHLMGKPHDATAVSRRYAGNCEADPKCSPLSSKCNVYTCADNPGPEDNCVYPVSDDNARLWDMRALPPALGRGHSPWKTIDRRIHSCERTV